MTGEQAKAAADVITAMWETEFPATCQVLAAVRDDNRSYRPDPKSRTAWELATHLATADIWFIDSIIKGVFEWNPDAAKQAESRLSTVNDVVELYSKTFPEKLKALRALPGEKLAETIDLLRHDEDVAGTVRRVREQPQHSSSWPARRLPSSARLEGAEHLRA